MNSTLNNNDLTKIFHKLGIKPKDKLQVNSNILGMLKSKENLINPQTIIDKLIKILTLKGTLLFPTFNWNFCKGYDFDYLKTKSLTGALSNLALQRKEFIRTSSPIYSFAVFGLDKEKIANMEHKDSFNLNSPFGYLIKNKGKNLFIDINYKDALTYAHVAEQTVGVNYRFLKVFRGNYFNINNQKRKISCKMYVRRLRIVKKTLIHKKFDFLMKKNRAIKQINYKNHEFSLIDIKKTYELMVNDIKKKGGMVYPVLYKKLK